MPEGQPESVRYDQINAMLLNEFLKEHKKVRGTGKQYCRISQPSLQQQKGLRDSSHATTGLPIQVANRKAKLKRWLQIFRR